MNLSLHIFKKDVFRARYLIGLWLVMVLAQFALVGLGDRPADYVMQMVYSTISTALPLFQVLMLVVLVPFVIQSEPLVGSTAFWFTRPISGRTLLMAKTYFAVFLLLVPLAVSLIVLVANDATPRDLALAAPQILMTQANTILGIALLAVLTRNFGFFAIAGACILMVTMGTVWALYLFSMFDNPEEALLNTPHLSLLKSKMIVSSILGIVLYGSLIAHQYLTRRTKRTVIAAVLSLLCMQVLSKVWSWDFMRIKPAMAEASFQTDAIDPILVDLKFNDKMSFRGGQDGLEKTASMRLTSADLPPAYLLKLEHAKVLLTKQDGTPIQTRPEGISSSSYAEPCRTPLEAAMNGIRLINGSGRSTVWYDLFSITTEELDTAWKKPARLWARLQVQVARYEVAAALPLSKGAQWNQGAKRLAIVNFRRDGKDLQVSLRERKLQLLFDPASKYMNISSSLNRIDTVYILSNPKRREAMICKFNPMGNFPTMDQNIVVNNMTNLLFGPNDSAPADFPEFTDEWLADAEILRMELRPVEFITRDITIEQLASAPDGRRATQIANALPFDPVALAKIVLPENPTKEQAREYIQAILLASRNQTSVKKTDPQMDMLAKVGPENIDLLIEGVGGDTGAWDNYYLTQAITRIARDEDKDIVIENLPRKVYLSAVILRMGWEKEARDILIQGLRGPNKRLHTDWIKSVVALEDPTTYDDLTEYLKDNNGMRSYTLGALKKLPDFDMQKAVDISWEKAKNNAHGERRGVMAYAAEYGHADALAVAAHYLRSNAESERKSGRKVFTTRTQATGDDAAILAWYDANKDQLVYDPATKKYFVSDNAP